MHLLNDPVFGLYALVATLVSLHLAVLGSYTGFVRTRRKVFVNPEDASTFKATGAEVDHPDVQRTKRAHMNALENAVPFLAIGFLYALSGPSKVGAQAYFFTYLGSRVLHSIIYLVGKQPWRTLMFAIGQAAILGMAVHVLRTVL